MLRFLHHHSYEHYIHVHLIECFNIVVIHEDLHVENSIRDLLFHHYTFV